MMLGNTNFKVQPYFWPKFKIELQKSEGHQNKAHIDYITELQSPGDQDPCLIWLLLIALLFHY
jgi:hypothetical protein